MRPFRLRFRPKPCRNPPIFDQGVAKTHATLGGMVAFMLCTLCKPSGLFPDGEPTHCFGSLDRPAPEGMLGGFRCSCPCRNDDRPVEHASSA